METVIFTFLSKLIVDGTLTTNGLLMIVILLLLGFSFYILRPMFKRIKEMPSKIELNTMLELKNATNKEYIENLETKLNKILTVVDKMDNIDSNIYREIKEIRRDIETVKQILNQFQGHMLFKRSSDFGNKELK